MHGILSIEEDAKLQRIRDFYERRNTSAPDNIETADCLNTIQFLLSVITKAETSPFRSMVPQLRGQVIYYTGKYKHGTVRHSLIFAHFSGETDKEKIIESVKREHPALMEGFEIAGVQVVPITGEDKRTFVLGSGI